MIRAHMFGVVSGWRNGLTEVNSGCSEINCNCCQRGILLLNFKKAFKLLHVSTIGTNLVFHRFREQKQRK